MRQENERPATSRIMAISKMTAPRNVKEVKSLLCKINYYMHR